MASVEQEKKVEIHPDELVNAVAEPGEAFADCVRRFLAPVARQSPMVMRAFKAQALAERVGAPRDERLRLETSAFVETWIHDDHWAAASLALKSDALRTKSADREPDSRA